MAIIEADVILALASRSGKHHREAVGIIKSVKSLKVPPYALIELDLLIMSRNLEIKISSFYEAFSKTLSYYGIEVVKPDPKHLAKGWELREKYNLTYFDSLQLKASLFRAGRRSERFKPTFDSKQTSPMELFTFSQHIDFYI